jgi:hypothetical protein
MVGLKKRHGSIKQCVRGCSDRPQRGRRVLLRPESLGSSCDQPQGQLPGSERAVQPGPEHRDQGQARSVAGDQLQTPKQRRNIPPKHRKGLRKSTPGNSALVDEHSKYVAEFNNLKHAVLATSASDSINFYAGYEEHVRRKIVTLLSIESLNFVVDQSGARWEPTWYKMCQEELAERLILKEADVERRDADNV